MDGRRDAISLCFSRTEFSTLAYFMNKMKCDPIFCVPVSGFEYTNASAYNVQAFVWCSWGINFTAVAKWWLHIWQALECGHEKWYLSSNDSLTLSLFASRWSAVTCHSYRYWSLSEWRMNHEARNWTVCTPASSKYAVVFRKATETEGWRKSLKLYEVFGCTLKLRLKEWNKQMKNSVCWFF